MEKVKPIKLTDPSTNEVYILEFSRESVKFAESRRFNISELLEFPQTNIPDLWFYAFRKNHKNVARSQTDRILEDLKGVTKAELERLIQLYNAPSMSLVVEDEGDERKNSKMTVEL